MRKLILLTAVAAVTALLPTTVSAKSQLHEKRTHKIVVSKAPYKRLGHALKVSARAVAVTAPQSVFAMFDAAVVDPFGVALQAFADGVDMYVVEPLQAAPPPLRQVGDGLFYVYNGLDKVGVVLAK
jgi:hypothetical protein